ncbi:hypothetical protein CHS0354_010566 [Potamilus streckersoni]|uniref:G-protein coupled receptors family 1 profile domain-containing protein n=1 Tax=Potamilus streckersoni TaxID=2493646 RepID=A0AAE0S5I1_9BIVA|nr:hypothetical protein CHS0354_010566 [Potamilus streckersoni]
MKSTFSDDIYNLTMEDESHFLYTVVSNITMVNDLNYSDAFPHETWSQERLIQVATMMTVMVITVIGNSVLIGMLLHKRSRRIKRVNIFIINLAVGDLAVACITMTTEILFEAFQEWVLGPVLCKLSVYLQSVALSSSTFLLTGMSIDRYQVIVKPLQSLARRPKISVKVCIAWVMAFVFAIPQLFIFLQEESIHPRLHIQVKKCVSRGYTAEWQRKRGGHKDISSDCRAQNKLGSPRMSVKRSFVSGSRRKVVVMTLTVIIAFIVCLTPYFIISMIRIFSNYTIQWTQMQSVSEIIFMLHSTLNPILYGLFTDRIVHMASICPSCRKKSRLRNDILKWKLSNGGRCCKLKRECFLLRRPRQGDTQAVKEDCQIVLKDGCSKKTQCIPLTGACNQTIVKSSTFNGNGCNVHAMDTDSYTNAFIHATTTPPDSGTDVSDV